MITPLNVSASAVSYALSVLDAQAEHADRTPRGKEQAAFYRGMLDMINILVSDAYTGKEAVERTPEGHRIHGRGNTQND